MPFFQFSQVLVFGIVILTLSCKSTSAVSTDLGLDAARTELGNDIDLEPSPAGTYLLYVQHQSGAVSSAVRFVVIDKLTHQILLKDAFLPGYVKWSGDATLEVLNLPGTLKKGEDLSKHIRQIQIRPLN